jgi:hypothetical protein
MGFNSINDKRQSIDENEFELLYQCIRNRIPFMVCSWVSSLHCQEFESVGEDGIEFLFDNLLETENETLLELCIQCM